MPQPERVNELIKRNIADLINREVYLKDGLITVSFVDCSPDLTRAKIGISVLPVNLSGTALKVLRGHSSLFTGILKKKTRLRHIPKFGWVIDSTEEEASKIEKLLEEIKEM